MFPDVSRRNFLLNSGMGLAHLKERLEAIGGKCIMQSTRGKGTRVEMTVSLNGVVSPVMGIGISALNN